MISFTAVCPNRRGRSSRLGTGRRSTGGSGGSRSVGRGSDGRVTDPPDEDGGGGEDVLVVVEGGRFAVVRCVGDGLVGGRVVGGRCVLDGVGVGGRVDG